MLHGTDSEGDGTPTHQVASPSYRQEDDHIPPSQTQHSEDPADVLARARDEMMEIAHALRPITSLKESLKYGQFRDIVPPVMRVSFSPQVGDSEQANQLKAELQQMLNRRVIEALPVMREIIRSYISCETGRIARVAKQATASKGGVAEDLEKAKAEAFMVIDQDIAKFSQSLINKASAGEKANKRPADDSLGNKQPNKRAKQSQGKGKGKGKSSKKTN